MLIQSVCYAGSLQARETSEHALSAAEAEKTSQYASSLSTSSTGLASSLKMDLRTS